MTKKSKHPAPTPIPTAPAVPDSTSSSNSSSSSSSSSSIQSAPFQGTGSWFGDFNALCFSSCVLLPTCNLLSAATTAADSFETSASALQGTAETGMGMWSDNLCLNNGGWPVRDVGSVVVSVLGLLFVVRQILVKSRRMFAAVGRTEIGYLYMIYSSILFLQVFTVGGVLVNDNRTHRTFLVWTTALHLGALVCFFWTLVITALVLFQFTDDGTKYMKQFITGTNLIWMGIVIFLSLDLAWNITGNHQGQSSGLFFLTLVFPAVAVLLYLVLSFIVVCRKLEVYSSLKYVAMALVTFSGSQLILFGASHKIAVGTQGRINGSMFAIVLDLVSVSLIYRFWNTITDDTWGDEVI
ncbi:chitin synthase III catalytic subunit [Linnemannia elongata]|nr:chitin synthase III catalytic subunit [Linnemannia elongata]